MIQDTAPVTTKPSPEGRLAKEMAVYDLLEELHIPYERVDHEEAASIEDCHNVDKLLGIQICKNLFFVQLTENGVLSSLDAGGKEVSDERFVEADRQRQTVICRG